MISATWPRELAALAVAGRRARCPMISTIPPSYGALLPEHSSGWNGRPGLAGSRSGRGWSPSSPDRVRPPPRRVAGGSSPPVPTTGRARGHDRGGAAPVGPRAPAGRSPRPRTGPYTVDGLPRPAGAAGRDRAARLRRPLGPGAVPAAAAVRRGVHPRENRRGRTGADGAAVLRAGTAGLRLRAGEVWAVHTAWSGNHVTTPSGCATGDAGARRRRAAAARRGRARARGDLHRPVVYGAFGDGLDGLAAPLPPPPARPAAPPAPPAAGRAATPGRRSTSTTTSTG